MPFMRETLKVGADTVVVGHSSGAVAAMRLAEETPVAALVLVSACHTDLGDPGERAAGYYARPWRWDAIRANAGRIVQFHSDNDPFIPDSEARHVAENLQSEYSELPGRSHFFTPPFAECLGVCREIAASSTWRAQLALLEYCRVCVAAMAWWWPSTRLKRHRRDSAQQLQTTARPTTPAPRPDRPSRGCPPPRPRR